MLLVVLDILVLVVLVQGLQLHHPNQQLLRQVLKLGLLGLLMLMLLGLYLDVLVVLLRLLNKQLHRLLHIHHMLLGLLNRINCFNDCFIPITSTWLCSCFLSCWIKDWFKLNNRN